MEWIIIFLGGVAGFGLLVPVLRALVDVMFPPPAGRTYALAEAPESTPLRVIGTVRAIAGERVLQSPISGRPCVYYRVSYGAAELRRDAVPFELVDGDDRVLVDPEHADVLLAGIVAPGESVVAVLAVGDRIAVFGSGTREPDPDAPPADEYRGAAATRLRLVGSRQHPLTITNELRWARGDGGSRGEPDGG